MSDNPASEQPKTTPEDLSMRDAWMYRRSFVVNRPERRELMALWGQSVPQSSTARFVGLVRELADAVESGEFALNFCDASVGRVNVGSLSPLDPHGGIPFRDYESGGAQESVRSGRYCVSFGVTDTAERAAAVPALSRYDSLEMHPASSGWPRKPWVLFRALQDAIRAAAPQEVQDLIEYEFANRKGAMRDVEKGD